VPDYLASAELDTRVFHSQVYIDEPNRTLPRWLDGPDLIVLDHDRRLTGLSDPTVTRLHLHLAWNAPDLTGLRPKLKGSGQSLLCTSDQLHQEQSSQPAPVVKKD
jgi:hypothetical protein